MAGSKSDYMENKVLDIVGGTTFTAPGTLYIGLWTSALSDTSTGATAGEVSGGSYARFSFTNNSTNWPAASGGSKSNGVEFAFTQATGNWGTVTHACIVDSASGAGNILYWWDLTASRNVQTNDIFKFAVGAIVLTEG